MSIGVRFYTNSCHERRTIRPIVPNQFGTDEYCTLCEQLGIDPYIGINYGSEPRGSRRLGGISQW